MVPFRAVLKCPMSSKIMKRCRKQMKGSGNCNCADDLFSKIFIDPVAARWSCRCGRVRICEEDPNCRKIVVRPTDVEESKLLKMIFRVHYYGKCVMEVDEPACWVLMSEISLLGASRRLRRVVVTRWYTHT